MMFALLVLGIIVLSVMGGALGGYGVVRWLGRAQAFTALSPTGYVCEECHEPALPYRTATGRRLCAEHKARG